MKTLTFPIYFTAKIDESSWDKSPCKIDGMEIAVRNWLYDRDRFISKMEVTIELPEDWNPIADATAELERQRAEVLADAQNKVNHINDKISKLQALTFDTEAA